MGGRGASSGVGDKGKKYGTEYTTLLQSGNIKFVRYNEGSATAPLETMTKGRVYVTVTESNLLNKVSYYDTANKRAKTIDLSHRHNGVLPHVHHGYEHNENDSKKGAANLTPEEKKMVAFVKKTWNNKKR
ncbi:MAG: hypothetical protein PHD32_05095 [Eubacteriales bacterium]|nr:hypothetical protein [Eubacteriales bacterium]